MGFKDLFINSENGNNGTNDKKDTKNTQSEFKSKFPSSGPITETSKVEIPVATAEVEVAITPDNPSCAPHLDKIMALYEQGFENLNMPGYDFFEFFQAVVQTGINNPATYNMALTMAKTMDKSVSKEMLLSKSTYYIDEINKVHQHYSSNGNTKRTDILKAKAQEESSLNAELTNINAEIARLNMLRTQKESELGTIDGKYVPQITEVECKLMANDIARERILGTINTVIEGIKNNL